MSKVKIFEINKNLKTYADSIIDHATKAQGEANAELREARALEKELISRIREREEKKKLIEHEKAEQIQKEQEAVKVAEVSHEKIQPKSEEPKVSKEQPKPEAETVSVSSVKPEGANAVKKANPPKINVKTTQKAEAQSAIPTASVEVIIPQEKKEAPKSEVEKPVAEVNKPVAEVNKPVEKPAEKHAEPEQKQVASAQDSPAQVVTEQKPRQGGSYPVDQKPRQGGSYPVDSRPRQGGSYPVNQRTGQGDQRQGEYRPRPQGQGDYRNNRQGDQRQGEYRPRPQGQGDYRNNNRQGDQRQGGYAPRPQGQGDYRNNNRPGGGYAGAQGNRGGYAGGGYQKPFDKDADEPDRRQTKRVEAKPKPGFTAPVKQNTFDNKKKKTDADNNRKKKTTFKEKGIVPEDEMRRRKSRRKDVKQVSTPIEPIKIERAVIPEMVSVKLFAERIGKPVADILKKLLLLGMMCNINSELDFDTASLIAAEYGIDLELKIEQTAEDVLIAEDKEDDDTDLRERPPVVTIMGHVDHGKTSLLDAIRKTKVTESEAGGITQHIGAYTVDINDRRITFLDTPGHEAFTAMRARGAQATDIAILVVAADDGVMPQTIEAINHAKAAKVPIIVAINKIDKEGADIDRIKQTLTEYELISEEWGGDTVMAPVSAKMGHGIKDLLEMILLVADVQELKANPDRNARGTIIEARLDRGRGPVATVLVQTGTLRVSDTIVAGTAYGRVRAMINDMGEQVKEAGPSEPVEVIGFSEVPAAGDIMHAVDQDKLSRQVASERRDKQKAERLKSMSKVSLDDLFSKIEEGQIQDLNLVVKADVQGSVEAVRQSLEKLSGDEVRVKVVHGGVGALTESDVMLASASNAIIIGFNVRPDATVTAAAERENVDIRLYRVIYNAIEDVTKAMKGMLAPEFKERVLGHAEVRQTFKVSAIGTIAGCYVQDGKIVRGASMRLVRDGIVTFEGKISTLKRFKEDAKEVATGYECGITIENFNDVKEGDVIEAYDMVEIER